MEVAGGIGSSAEVAFGSRSVLVYMECMKNHVAVTGGHAVDGCGEFMSGGPDGTTESFTCAACNCHRNFHRRVLIQAGITSIPLSNNPRYRHGPTTAVYNLNQRPMASGSTTNGELGRGEQENMSEARPKKRFRTNFTQEQKDKMYEFSEKLGWKVHKHDDADVEQFCKETGIKMRMLKVWMHNNKNTYRKNDENPGGERS